ncbi:hypothetical protein EFQH95_1505 [Enterococcus faecalis]|nr:hypothetical protein EFQH95_1505 [Enterococcus faecalis]OSH42826.1 hypothetical protein YM116_0382 [Enterococcus faecalis]
MKLPLNTLISTSTAKDPTKDKIALLTKFTKKIVQRESPF